MMKIESRCPTVVRKPTGGTLPMTSALSDEVVPWAMWWVSASISSSVMPSCSARATRTSITPWE
jgi:hypothetical protein